MLSIVGLTAWYDKNIPILNNVNLEIDENMILGLIGNNGSGKTTLIKTISSIHQKYTVENAKFKSKDFKFNDDFFKLNRITVFTEDETFKYWTFKEYLNFMVKVYNKKYDERYLNYLIDGFSFRKYIGYVRKDLSLGNKKKFSLIAAFCLQLSLIILDEPVDGLDFESTLFLYEVIKKYKEFGSVFMSTHILESVELTCDEIIILKGGFLSKKHQVESRDKILSIIQENFND